jgi:hypothetical protein
MVERLHAHALERLEFRERRLRIDHVPVVGKARVVDLQHKTGIDDRLVFFAHGVGGGEDEVLRIVVMHVLAAREAARADGAHETFGDAGRRHRLFQIVDVGCDGGLAGVSNGAGADRTARTPARGAADQRAGRFRVLVEFGEFLPVATVGEARQRKSATLDFLCFDSGTVSGETNPAMRAKA